MKLISPTKRDILLPPDRPNAGRQAAYYTMLNRLLARMVKDVQRELERAYRPVATEIAQDASPLARLRDILRRMTTQWTRIWMEEAPEMAETFLHGARADTDRSFQSDLKTAGFTVKFKPTRALQQKMAIAAEENVRLIRSIGEEYLDDVAGSVLRSALAGRDLKTLTDDLVEKHGIARRRAAFIARDQNNKITSVVTRERRKECGMNEAIWLHNHAAKKPRPSHVKAGREKLRFNIEKGAYLDGEWVHPGELPNCGCRSRPIIPGYND